jgi:hypothetical protein
VFANYTFGERMATAIDMSGLRFGRLVVLKRAAKERGRHRQAVWECLCDCGGTVVAMSASLRRGHTKSCGCYQIDRVSTHGKTKTAEYVAWYGIKDRCYRVSSAAYVNYGARGITVCDRWRDSFENFIADMGEKPSKLHSLDRIDNSRGYSPDNCRWATRSEQNRNTRQNRLLNVNGEVKCLTDWAEEYGLTERIVRQRIDRLGWSVEKALNTPKIY